MNFQIMQHDGGRNFIPAIHDVTKKPLIYDDAKKAAEIAKRLTEQKGVKFQPRPVADKADWQERERNRFKNGEYTPVIWIKEPWWKEIDNHFVHVGVKDKTRIAFTPDAKKGAVDLQTAMLPGKYLQQFFGDVLNTDQVRDFAMQHSAKYEENGLKFATTVQEIEHVYKNGPTSSCFYNSTKANLYGSGDFAVAYIVNKGKITARTICVPERKVYVYAYGDTDRLKAAMTKAGYEYAYDGTNYKGLRLLKKWWWDGFYPDWGGYRKYVPDPKDDRFLIVRSGGY